MRRQFARRMIFALVLLLLSFTVGLDEASAQRRRVKRSRRATNPVVVAPVKPSTQTTEPQIISTADEQTGGTENGAEVSGQLPSNTVQKSRPRATEAGEEASMQRTVNDLSAQVNKLSEKLSQMEAQQRTLVDLERLSRAEQRAEALRAQLRDAQEKEGSLQARMEQLNYDLKPESIERSVATYGSTRPEEARDARRHALESEKTRLQAQLDLLLTSRQRLEAAIVSADLEVDKLRRRIDDATDTTPSSAQSSDTERTEESNTATQPGTQPNSQNSSAPPQ